MFFKPRERVRPVRGPSHSGPRFSASSRHRQRKPAGRMLIGCMAGVSAETPPSRRRAIRGMRERERESPDDPFSRVSDIARRDKGVRILWCGYFFFFLLFRPRRRLRTRVVRTNGRTNDDDVTAWNCVGNTGFVAIVAIEKCRIKGFGWRHE